MDENLVVKAKWAAIVEKASEDNPAKLLAVASALLDAMDYALKIGVISDDSQSLPDELDPILSCVYNYLGDPL